MVIHAHCLSLFQQAVVAELFSGTFYAKAPTRGIELFRKCCFKDRHESMPYTY